MTEGFFQWYDRIGRPTLRLVGVVIIAMIGSAIAVAMWRWSFGAELKPLPGSAILVSLVPVIPQALDQITRAMQRNAEIAFGRVPGGPMPNPHGGPAAP